LKLSNKIDESLNEILYLGKQIPIIVKPSNDKKYVTFSFKKDILEVELYDDFTLEIKKLLKESFYKQQAPILFFNRVQELANLMNLHPTNISFRKAKTRWGSCSHKNSISLNIGLVMLPKELSDYIIVHELAHIQEKNHSRNFWKLVQNYCPNYKVAKEKLKKYSNLL